MQVMPTTKDSASTNGVMSKPHVSGEARREGVRTSLENLATRAWTPFEAVALRAQSLLPFFPRVTLTLSDDRLDVEAEVPGVDSADLDVSFEDGALEIRGTKRAEREIRTKNCDRTERYHTPFQRRVRVRAAVDAEKVGATLKNGILVVRLPRAKGPTGGAQRIRIPISPG